FDIGRALRLAAVAGAALAVAPVARAADFSVTYGVTIVGLRIGTGTLVGHVAGGRYNLTLNGGLAGIAKLLVHQAIAAGANGGFGGALTPDAFAMTAARGGDRHTIRMSMGGGAVRAVQISPKPRPPGPEYVPLAPGAKVGVVDPLSAFLMPAANAVPGPGACDRTLRIFDSEARFDVAMSFDSVANGGARGYSGPVALCTARYRPLSGYRRDKAELNFETKNPTIEVALAPAPGVAAFVPYRVVIQTSIGPAVIQAEAISGGVAKKASR
ncbi:MAG: DUF3108 domain-containing protein, partial [Hyphomicrobiales bacterium]|nr:DUF3108 domain-containing protein [Hyphomicrobiales bacterium]